MSTFTVHTDGGARGNPGPAAIGVVMRCGEWEWKHNRYIGTATNNVAEYSAILDALIHLHTHLKAHGTVEKIEFFLDSELVVRQLNGQYRVKEPSLQPLFQAVQSEIRKLSVPHSIAHVRRHLNEEADALVNQVLDEHVA